MKKVFYNNVLIGRNKRKAILETHHKETGITFKIKDAKGNLLASRSTTQRYNEEETIIRLAKAVNGMSYVYIVPVPTMNERAKEKFYRTNN